MTEYPEQRIYDRAPRKRTVILFAAIVAGVIIIGLLLQAWLTRAIRNKLEVAVVELCATVDPITPPRISVNVLAGRVSISGLRLIPDTACAESRLKVTGSVDSLTVDGISLWKLLRQGSIDVSQVILRTTDITVQLASVLDSSATVPPAAAARRAFLVDRFNFTLRNTRLISANRDTVSNTLIHLQGDGFTDTPRPNGTGSSRSLAHYHIDLQGLVAHFANGYRCTVLTGTTASGEDLLLRGLSIAPRIGLQPFSDALELETDVIEAAFDSMELIAFNMNDAINNGVFAMRGLALQGGKIIVQRDKTKPDEPFKKKPLISSLLRALPIGSGADSVVIERLDVVYREQVDAARGYASVPFHQISGTITGARNTIGSDTLRLHASCSVFDGSPVSMSLTAALRDSSDGFTVEASIGPLSFAALNQATGPLLDVRAESGIMDTLHLHMAGNDDRASGTVRMRYTDLRVFSGTRSTTTNKDKLLTVVLNTVIKKKDRPKAGDLNEAFTVERRKDRAVFNYLWSGLREGTKATLLPNFLSP